MSAAGVKAWNALTPPRNAIVAARAVWFVNDEL